MRISRNRHVFHTLSILIMVLALTSGMTLAAFACDKLPSVNILFSAPKMSGTSASSLDSLFGDKQSESEGVSTQLTDVLLANRNGTLVFQGNLTYNNETFLLQSSGVVYKNEKTEHSGTYADTVLGDMHDSGNFHFVRLRVDKEPARFSILLQTNDTKQLLNFEIPIEKSVFDTLYNTYENPIGGIELEQKIIELYFIANDLVDKDSLTFRREIVSPPMFISPIQP